MAKNTFNFLDYCPGRDSYMEKLALEGKLPECTYNDNGLPAVTEKKHEVAMDDLFDVVGEREKA